ncbi:beta-galactosidase [Arthrobacter pascens]|uniref:beta-galactosidase n=1 Tax=Arthrobacter pascens TaxID=1677 RepID=UPI002792AF2B|nr:beta-galactosidase [Arthrobacter pascens]MDQ0676992.1 beta-galactosidase [Arthrobacter pascens]
MSTPARSKTRTLGTSHQAWDSPFVRPAMSNTVDVHQRYRVTNRYVEIGGKPGIPVSGELHFSRLPRERWEERLRLMKGGGITVVACYIFWIHHEEHEGGVRFDGNLDVAGFVRLCDSIGLDVVLRIGPWCHGEVRNGGFPDWVQASRVEHRTNDPAYLRLVKGWFGHLGAEVAGLTGPASNIIGIQLENELYDQPEHIRELKDLAREAGLSAPIWTATAWGGADLPQEEVLPLFGGYGDGFWVDADSPWDPTFREHYFFSHVWDDPGIGADLREHLSTGAAAAAPRTPSALYPPATCELAGGMATAYQRRPWPGGLDVAAVAHNKIGNGSAWQGYYMFVGGTNPADGMQESHATGYPNDLPRYDYDFHAPIGSSGRLAPSFSALRKQHAFLAAFGDRLAQMPSTLPTARPAGIEDTETLRWALRSDGQSGFVFITWHQPHIPLLACPDTQFEIGLQEASVTFPSRPTEIPPGTIAHWPVNLDVAGVMLQWATASPLTILSTEVRAPSPTLVLAAEAGVPVEFRFADGTTVSGPATALGDGVYVVETEHPVTVTARAGESALDLLVLPAPAADQAWVLDTINGRELILSKDPVWVAASGRLGGRAGMQPEVLRYRPDSRSFTAVAAQAPDAGQDERPVGSVLRVGVELRHPARPVPPSYGTLANRASAPTPETIDALAQTYSINLPAEAFTGELHTELEIAWAGDIAQLLVDGTVVADRFWDGSPWILEIHDAGIHRNSEVTLQILPLSREARVGVPAEAQRRRDGTPGDLVELDSVQLVCWCEWLELDHD